MVTRLIFLTVCLISAVSFSFAQDFGVWIATAHRIDFPKTNGKDNQIREMKQLIDESANAGLTTLYFQVRGRGDAFYQSDYEPWSESLTGTLGQSPGYDPLEQFVTYAKSKNLRVIGWFNVFKVADQSNQINSKSKQKHPAERNPGWIIKSGSEKFLNPGIPDVRQYLANVAADLVSKYELDGIQLDFCRYPTTAFNDKKAELKYNRKKQSTGDWRRQNITTTVEMIRDAIKEERPEILLTAAPLGICKAVPNARGLESYYEVYQDSFGWLESGLIDEVEPQIYWPLGNIPDGTGAKTSPDFDALSRDWQKKSNGKLVRPGIALYKKPVADQVDDIIESALANGNQGVVFYAWSQFKELNINLSKFTKPENTTALVNPVKSESEIKIEKLTNEQILLHNAKDKSYSMYRLLDKSGSVVKSGSFNDESVVMLSINGSIHKVEVFDKTDRLAGSIQFDHIK